MPQGWNVSATTDVILFLEPPATGASNIEVKEYASNGYGGTDVWAVGAWSYRYGYPREIEFYADRLWFANTPFDPQTIWASCIGDYVNHGRSSPIVDSDAVSFAINSRQVNVVKDLVPLDNLLVLTTGGEYKVTGGQDDVVTPSTIGVKNQGNSGTGDVQARVIGESAIMMQEEGQKVRDLRYQFEKDGFRGNEISVWADHLFEGFSISWIEYWKAPWQVVWFVRDDGILIGCTYMPEQEVIGWHDHDTDGDVLDVCALPGKHESECYFLTRRVIDGVEEQYIEQQAPTKYTDDDDMFFVDCGVTYDGRNSTAISLELSTADNWTEEGDITATSSNPIFAGATDEGDGFILRTEVTTVVDGEQVVTPYSVRLVIIDYLSATTAKVRPIGTVPEPFRDVPLTTWTFRRDTISDLWHLEGKTVKVLQDGAVAGPFTVTNGAIVLDEPGGVVHIGLGYTCEVETLELNAPGGEPMRDNKKLLYKASILVLGTRGVMVGDVRKDGRGQLFPVKDRNVEPYGTPPSKKTGLVEIDIPSDWGVDAGCARFVSSDPLPMELLSITLRAAASS